MQSPTLQRSGSSTGAPGSAKSPSSPAAAPPPLHRSSSLSRTQEIAKDAELKARKAKLAQNFNNNDKRQHKNAVNEDISRQHEFEEQLAEMLTNKHEEIDFSHLNLGPQHAKLIADALKTLNGWTGKAYSLPVAGPSKLVRLDLFDNNLGDEGLKELARGLKRDRTLRYLNLKWNNLGAANQVGGMDNDSGVLELAKALASEEARASALTQVNVEWNRIWLVGREALANLSIVDGSRPARFISIDRGLPPPLPRRLGEWDFGQGRAVPRQAAAA